ncbi:TIGR00730 family Rossman fold protein [Microbaculum marinum]|uniref:Cytokinin riboside 5'-monophosphate phosphoribohydrolase n=1 Tax=Microbaculum marinum TaxID=1764581 RepID=A0AAW9RVH1_9HYPH
MSTIKNICVYCGSGDGQNPAFKSAAHQLGRLLAENGIGLVYGGGSLGLMGTVARGVLRHNGHVTGIIPEFLTEREQMLRDVQELVVTRDMHERKRLMFERSDAFVALPGGIGTLEETVEMLTWGQLGQHAKPVALANIEGYWDPLCELLSHMRTEKFIRQDLEVGYLVVDTIDELIPSIRAAAEIVPEPDLTDAQVAERM